MRLFYYISRFNKFPNLEKKFLIIGYLYCILFYFLVKILPLKYYINILKFRLTDEIIDQNPESIINLAKKTMCRLDKLFFIKMSCLIKSCVFKSLLNAQGVQSQLILGMKFSDMKIDGAHAFIKLNNHTIYLEQQGFVEVHSIY
jgi:hypothetical protein